MDRNNHVDNDFYLNNIENIKKKPKWNTLINKGE